MKIIIIIFSLYMMSGPVGCTDLIGYTGGSVMIICNRLEQPRKYDIYFCKEPEHQCVYMTSDETQNTWDHKGRVLLYESNGIFSVLFRNLSVQDSGSYQCGEAEVKNHYNLTVKTDPCCGEPETVIGYLRETVTISCSYPEQFKTNPKNFFKLYVKHFTLLVRTANPQIGRFSMADDRSSKVLSMTIRDVRGDNAGVYSCGQWDNSGRYYSLFREIHLQVTGEKRPTQKPPTTGSTLKPTASTSAPDEGHFSSIFIIIIITVSVCVVLMLTGGSALIFYRLRVKKTEGSVSSNNQRTENNTADVDYVNNPPGNQQHMRMDPIYQTLQPNTNQSDSVYQTLNLNTNQSDSVYQSLKPTATNQIVYQGLNPNSNQSGSVYQKINPNTNQSDSVYQSLNPKTNQSDSIYQSLNPYTNQSGSV